MINKTMIIKLANEKINKTKQRTSNNKTRKMCQINMTRLVSSFLLVFVFMLCPTSAYCIAGGDWPSGAYDDVVAESYATAYLNITYEDLQTRKIQTEKAEIGKYGDGRIGPSSGVLVHVTSLDGGHTGCAGPIRSSRGNGSLPQEPWIALIKRGQCNFEVKVENAYRSNATAVIVYNDRESLILDKMKLATGTRNITAIFTYKWKGEELARLVDNGSRVMVQVTVATHCTKPYPHINRTSVLFVSISFIVLMIISLAWLVFYYVQRFRYMHAKDRLSRRLCNAAKKALSKIPTKQIQTEDREVQGDGECCAVCIEPYKVSDDLRILPCKHEFHKSCIDPWLLEHRTCPMCKMDILKHYGFVYTGSQESILQLQDDRTDGVPWRVMPTTMSVQSEPVSRVTTPDDFTPTLHIPGTFPSTLQRPRMQRESSAVPQNSGTCEHNHCCPCCSNQINHINEVSRKCDKKDLNSPKNSGCCLVKQNCCNISGTNRDPDKAQLLDNDNFYDTNSTDSSSSSPLHNKYLDTSKSQMEIHCFHFQQPSHKKHDISKTYNPRLSQTYNSQFCDNISSSDNKRFHHRRTVSCNDLKKLDPSSSLT